MLRHDYILSTNFKENPLGLSPWVTNGPFKLDSHGDDVSIQNGSVGLTALLHGVPPGLQPVLSLLVKLLQAVRLTAAQGHIFTTSH